MCVLLHLLICTALRAHIIVVEALYKINYYYYYYLFRNAVDCRFRYAKSSTGWKKRIMFSKDMAVVIYNHPSLPYHMSCRGGSVGWGAVCVERPAAGLPFNLHLSL